MNSKEALERLLKYVNINEAELITKYGYSALNDVETIEQDLDRLEKLEKENASLQSENQELKLHILAYRDTADTFLNQLEKLEKVINILKDKIEFEDLGEMQSGNMYRGYFNDCLDEEEVKSVKEVLNNE